MMCTKVCFLLTEHPFLDARIFKKEAKTLFKHGYDVTMIVPRKEGYLFDVDGSIFHNSFRSKEFVHEGIKVVTYEQMYLERDIRGLFYNLRTNKSTRFNDPLTLLGIEQEADIYHAHEFFSLYSGIGIKRALTTKGRQIKVIYDSHELEPDPLIVQSDKVKKIKQQMLTSMLKETNYVITVSESIKSWFSSIDPHLQVEVIYNSPPLATEYKPKEADKPGLLLAYEGVLNKSRGDFQKLMKIVEMCNNNFDLKLKIIGGGKHSQNNLNFSIPSHLTDKVICTGWVNYDSIPKVMKDVDLGWVDLDANNSLNNRFAMPNKFFSYLNNGIPVLANQCKDMEAFIQTYQCGYTVKKLDATAQDYFQALLHLHSNREKIQKMGLQARKVMESQFSWEHMEEKLFAIYDLLDRDM